MMFLVLAAAAQTGVAQSAAFTAWGEFARVSGHGLSPITVTVGSVPIPSGGHPIYWAKRTGRAEGGSTDSLRCPALLAVVDSMRQFRLPTPQPGDPDIKIADGTIYSLTVPSSYHPAPATNLDKITITSGDGPLAEWVKGAFTKLEPCWSPK